MDASKRKYILPAVGVILVLAAVYVAWGNRNAGVETGVTVGSRAQDVEVQLLNGEKVKVGDYRGELLVIDFMAPWCSPCWEEIKILGQIYDRPGVQVLSINVDPTINGTILRQFAEEIGIVWSFGSSPQAAVDYKVTGIPDVILVDRQGVIRYRGHYTPLSQFLDLFNRYG
jgi:thiol-disulfide isomerase/thioredoxin